MIIKPSNARLNPGHPYARRMVGGWLFSDRGSQVIDLTGNNHGTIVGSTITSVVDQYGRAMNCTADNSTDRINLGSIVSSNPLSLSQGLACTIIARMYVNSGTKNNTFPRIIDKSNSGSGAGGWAMDYSGSGVLEFYINGSFMSGPSTNVISGWHTFGFMRDESGNYEYFIDEESIGSGNDTTAFPTTTTNAALLNWNHSTDRAWNGKADYIYVFDERLTETALRQITATPWMILDTGLGDDIYIDTSNSTVSVPAGAITLTGYAPTVDVPAAANVSVPAGSITLTGNAPTVVAGLTLENEFERSNIDMTNSSVSAGVVTIKPRIQTVDGTTAWQFFMARLINANGETPTFNVPVASHYLGTSLSNFPQPMFSYDRSTWTYFGNSATVTSGNLVFSHTSAFTSSTVYVAYAEPFGMTELASYIASWGAESLISEPPSSSGNSFVANQTISQTADDGRTVPPQNIYSLKLSDSSVSPGDGGSKRHAVISAGTHAGEDCGNWSLKGAIDFLLSSDPIAVKLRSEFDWYIYPMMNPAGRYGGNFRGCWEPGEETLDPNLHMYDDLLDVVVKHRTAILGDTSNQVDLYLEFHGWKTDLYGYYAATTSPTTDLISAVEVYAGTMGNHGSLPSALNNRTYFYNEWGAAYNITPEIGYDEVTSRSQMENFGVYFMKGVNDRFAYDFTYRTIDVPAGSITLTGYAPSVSAGGNISVDVPVGAISLTGYAPSIAANGNLSIDVPSGAISLSGFAPSVAVSDHKTISVPTGAISITGYAPTVQTDASLTIDVPSGAITATGYAPTVLANVSVNVHAGAVILTGYAPSVLTATTVSVPLGAISLTRYAPTVGTTGIVAAPLGTIVLTGYAPSVSDGGPVAPTPTTRTLVIESESRTLVA